jgi:DNA-binding PadR family transcriptional regulator
LSPVFRHGSLRLYLLRLLDEEPRHGYEVIRLLRDRFMGVYSPSPGTIYPRLARLEEEGLVTHDEVEGRKVYRITELGREELRSRSDELDELEEELSASVSDIVREVREDVRETVRSLREELTWAARESRRVNKDAATDVRDQARQAKEEARSEARRVRDEAREQARQAKEEAREQVRQAREDVWEQAGRSGGAGPGSDATRRVHEQAQRLREEAQRAREEAMGAPGPGRRMHEEAAGARFGPGEQDWDTPPGWAGWPGRRGWEDWSRMRGRPGRSGPLDFGTFRDLERLAVQFTSDLRKLAMQSSGSGENVISDLRSILEEALERIKSEIFGPGHAPGPDGEPAPDAPAHDAPASAASAAPASDVPASDVPVRPADSAEDAPKQD